MKELSVGKVLLFLVGVGLLTVGVCVVLIADCHFKMLEKYYPAEMHIGLEWQLTEVLMGFGVMFSIFGFFILMVSLCWIFAGNEKG